MKVIIAQCNRFNYARQTNSSNNLYIITNIKTSSIPSYTPKKSQPNSDSTALISTELIQGSVDCYGDYFNWLNLHSKPTSRPGGVWEAGEGQIYGKRVRLMIPVYEGRWRKTVDAIVLWLGSKWKMCTSVYTGRSILSRKVFKYFFRRFGSLGALRGVGVGIA